MRLGESAAGISSTARAEQRLSLEEQARQPRALVIGHVSRVDVGVELLENARSGASNDFAIDVLAYGRGARELYLPHVSEVITAPGSGDSPLALARAALALVLQLRRRRYAIAVVSQPHLRLSRARGLLLAAPFFLGADRVLEAVDNHEAVGRPVRRSVALQDLAVWLAVRLAALIAVPLFVLGIRVAERGRRRRVEARDGAVIYLRTDLELRLAPLLAGGSAAHTTGVIGALLSHGRDVELWSTGAISGVPHKAIQHRLPGLLLGNVPLEIGEFMSGLLQAARVRPTRPGVIYQRYSLNNLAGVLLRARLGVPLVLEANASEVKWRRDAGTLRLAALAEACERFVFRSADLIVAVSDNAAADIIDAGAVASRVKVVPNGVDFERFADVKPAELPFPPRAFVVAFAGLFYPWHGIQYLGEAFVVFHRACPDAHLLLVGDGEDAALLRRILRDGGVERAVYWTGLVDRAEVPSYLAAADVLVSPHAAGADFIGSPIKLFEYMAAGRPIVATEVAQLAQILRDGENALVVSPANAGALAAALKRLYSDERLRVALAEHAQDEAARFHSWDARVGEILASLENR